MKESDIRPESLLHRYLELSEQDAKLCFAETPWREIPCVACESDDLVREFEKNGFAYASCQNCGTLFQSPRPSIEAFEAFYRNSVSSRYWAEVFFPAVAETRREKIFKPRVQRLVTMCDDIGLNVSKLIDVGAGYGIFLDEWRAIKPNTELLAVEPSASLSDECRNKGLNVVEAMAENVTGYVGFADLVVCFEVLEHVDNPLKFITVLKKMVKPGGYLFVSTLCIDGFDLQMLWDKSSQIFPPHHINFHSVKGFKLLFQRAGLKDISVTTPGQLDVDIVKNFTHKRRDLLENNRFLKTLLSDKVKSASFQQFLADNQLSSHAWVLGKNPEELN